jgi:hypothetical protein
MKTPATDSQNARILAALRAGDKLTALTALKRFHCLHLASRIDELRKAGHTDITSTMIRLRNKKRIAEYSIPS